MPYCNFKGETSIVVFQMYRIGAKNAMIFSTNMIAQHCVLSIRQRTDLVSADILRISCLTRFRIPF